jgi:hypothetical protein
MINQVLKIAHRSIKHATSADKLDNLDILPLESKLELISTSTRSPIERSRYGGFMSKEI